MKRNSKRALAVLGILAGLIVIASVAVRLVLTEDRLRAMIVPRIEKALDAEISFGGIGIRFPFGFGVSVDDLAFSRAMPGGGRLGFRSDGVVVNASLMSLLRRRPEITSVDVDGGVLDIEREGESPDLRVEAITAGLSMKPVEGGYILDPVVTTGPLTVDFAGDDADMMLPGSSFEGTVRVTEDFDSISVERGALGIADIIEMSVEGSLAGLQARRRFDAGVSAEGLEPAVMIERISAAVEEGRLKAGGALEILEDPPAKVEGGTVSFEARASGSAGAPGGIDLRGVMTIEGLRVTPGALDMTAGIDGEIGFTGEKIESAGISIEAKGAEVTSSFSAVIDRESMRIGRIDFAADARIDAAELGATLAPGTAPESGRVVLEVEGGAVPFTMTRLFPSGARELSQEDIAAAWGDLDLTGKLSVTGLSMTGAARGVPVSGLDMTATLSGGDITGISADMLLQGSPWRLEGDMKGVLPALAALQAVTSSPEPPASPGAALDALEVSPDMSFSLSGRSFDARPLQKGEDRAEGAPAPGEAAAEGPSPLSNPVTLLALKKTFLSVRIDTLIAEKALVTGIDATARISNGIVSADPVSLEYAGGTGRGRVLADLRAAEGIEAEMDIDFAGVQASRALSPIGAVSGLLSGDFAFTLDGSFATGPEVEPLTTLVAAGKISSDGGKLDLSRFVAPLQASGLSLESLKTIEFRSWWERFRVDGGRVAAEEWRIESPSGDWDISGSFGFDGTLDYRATLVLSPAQQARMKDLSKFGDLVSLFEDDQGNVVLPFDIGGTAASPRMKLDQSAARKRAGEKLEEEAKKKLLDLFRK